MAKQSRQQIQRAAVGLLSVAHGHKALGRPSPAAARCPEGPSILRTADPDAFSPEYTALMWSTPRIFHALFSGHLPNFFQGNLGFCFMPCSKSWKVVASKCPHLPLRCAVSDFSLHNPCFCPQTTALFPWDPACYPAPHGPLVMIYPAQAVLPWSPRVSLSCQHHAQMMARSFPAVFFLLQTTTGSCFTAAKADLCISLCY